MSVKERVFLKFHLRTRNRSSIHYFNLFCVFLGQKHHFLICILVIWQNMPELQLKREKKKETKILNLGERAIASHGMYESLFKLLYMPLPLMPPPPCIMYVKS